MNNKINFRALPVYTGIAKKEQVRMDVAESLADYIYQKVPGLVAHVLSEKIYKSTGEIELTDQERNILLQVSLQMPGAFTDAIKENL